MSEIEINETIPFEGEFVEVPCDEQGIVPAENADEVMNIVVDDDDDEYGPQFTAGQTALAMVAVAAGGYGIGKFGEFAYRKWVAPFCDKLAEKWANKRSSEKKETPKIEGVKEDLVAAEQLRDAFVNEQKSVKTPAKAGKKRR